MVIYSDIVVDVSSSGDRLQHCLLKEVRVNWKARTRLEGDNGLSKGNVAGTRKLGQRREEVGVCVGWV